MSSEKAEKVEKAFWNQKILAWERNKYTKSKIFDVNSSVKYRLRLAASLLHQTGEGKNLLELGCGSGHLWDQINTLNLSSYTGVDFSEAAIAAFQKKVQGFKKFKVSLLCSDCVGKTPPADMVISLGLLDWLPLEKIKTLSETHKNSWYLHSFSEKRLSLPQMAHSFYVFVNYGYKTGPYSPRYRRADDLLSIFGSKAKIHRDSRLSFGAFIHHLPDTPIQFEI